MLVLTRKMGDGIIIDSRIRIRVLRVQGNRVRIGIEAPDDIPILRSELDAAPLLGEAVTPSRNLTKECAELAPCL